MAAIKTEDQLKEEVGKLASGEQGVTPKVKAVLPTVKDKELQSTKGATVTGDVKASTAGAITLTPPSSAGQAVVRVGEASTATQFAIRIEPPIKLS